MDEINRAIAELGEAQLYHEEAFDADDPGERQEALDEAGLCAVKALMDVLASLTVLRGEGANIAHPARGDEAVLTAIANFPLVAQDAVETAQMIADRIGARPDRP